MSDAYTLLAPRPPEVVLRSFAASDAALAALVTLQAYVRKSAQGWSLLWINATTAAEQRSEQIVQDALGAEVQPERDFRFDANTHLLFGQAAAAYLTDPYEYDDHAAHPTAAQLMFVAHDVRHSDVRDLIEMASQHGTGFRAALLQIGGLPSLMVQVRYDRRRRASVEPLITSGFGDRATVLRPYPAHAVTNGLVFLPEAPAVGALNHVAQIFVSAPKLFSDNFEDMPLAQVGQYLFAVTDNQLIDLRRIQFQPLYDFDPEFRRPEFSTAVADSSKSLDKLTRALRSDGNDFGVSLELRETRLPQRPETELVEVNKEIKRLERRRRRLERKIPERLSLARIPDIGLAPIAALIRGFHVEAIAQGVVSYARVTSGHGAQAHHYFLFDRNRASMTPLFSDQETLKEVTWFETDQIIQSHYSSSARFLIFTPERRALYPTPHSLEVAEFDGFMNQMLNRWSDGQRRPGDQSAEPRDPGKSILLFEKLVQNQPRLQVMELKREDFRPIETDLISWLNDVQYIGTESPDWDLSQHLSAKLVERRTQDLAGQEAADRIASSQNAIKDAYRQVSEDSREFLGALNQHIDQMAARATARQQEAQKIGKDVDAIMKDYSNVAQVMEKIKKIRDKMEAEASSGTEQAEKELSKTMSGAAAIDVKVKSAAAERESQVRSLQNNLDSLRLRLDRG